MVVIFALLSAAASADTVFSITPASLQQLIDQLSSGASVSFLYTQSFTRPGPPEAPVISMSTTIPLAASTTQEFYSMLTLPSYAHIVVPDVVPDLVRLSNSATPTTLSPPTGLSISLQLAGGGNKTVLQCLNDGNAVWFSVSTPSENPSTASAGLRFTTISDDVPSAALTAALGASGIIAIYATVVMSVANFAREALGTATERIAFENMPDTFDLMELVETIKVCETETYAGHYADEQRLFELVVNIFRSPEVLMQVTKEKLD